MKRIEIRGDDEFCLMLDQLEADELIAAQKENRDPLNRTQIIRQAVREYYAAHANGKAQNAFLDMMRSEIELVFNDYFAKQYAVMNKNMKQMTAHLDNQDTYFKLYWRMFLNQNNWCSIKDSERLKGYLTQHPLFEDVLDEMVDEKKKGGNL